MARNGSGTFTRIVPAYVFDTVISETSVNSEMDDIATALTASLAKDGQTTPTANLPMGTYRHTGVGTGTARTDYAALGQVQDGSANWVDGGGTADVITATYSPVITALVDGQLCFVRATLANATTTPTFNPSGLGAGTIVKNGGVALAAGDIVGDGHQLILRYDLAGTQWELLNPAVAAASDTAAGIVELATTAETTTGTDATRAVTPDGLHDMTSLAGAAWFLDEDAMGSDSATKVASQQSIKAYVTTAVGTGPGRVKIIDNDWSTGTPASVTFEDADGMNWSTYSYFDIELSGYISASCRIICTMSQGGVYETGATDYHYANTGQQFSASFSNGTTAINIPSTGTPIYKGGGQYNEMFHLKASLYPGLSDGTNIDGPYIHWSFASNVSGTGNRAHANGTGALRNLVATEIDGIKFELSTGTMNNGSFKVWGIK